MFVEICKKMLKILLFDFQFPGDEEEQYSSDYYFKLLKNHFKTESEEVIKNWERIDRYLAPLKRQVKKFTTFYDFPKDLILNEFVIAKVSRFIRSAYIFNQIPQYLRERKRVALKIVSEYGCLYFHLGEELKKDRDVCLAALKSYPIYIHLSEEFKNDRVFVLTCLNCKYDIVMPKQFYNDREIVKELVKRKSLMLISDEMPKEFLDDKEIALNAIKKCNRSVSVLSERLQHDCGFVLAAVRSNIFSYCHFPKSMKENRML